MEGHLDIAEAKRRAELDTVHTRARAEPRANQLDARSSADVLTAATREVIHVRVGHDGVLRLATRVDVEAAAGAVEPAAIELKEAVGSHVE